MISYPVYKIVHLAGIMMLFSGLGAMALSSVTEAGLKARAKSVVFSLHGAGLFLVLLGGFGMLARLGVTGGLPSWIYAKLAIWAILGGSVAVLKRSGKKAWLVLACTILLALTSAYFALYKPFG